jgi:PST family polysaccharide transporter
MKNLTRKTVQGTVWISIGYVLQILGRLAVLAVLTRLLTPGDFGVMAAAMLIIGLGEVAAPLGSAVALIRYQTVEPIHVKAALTISFLTAALLIPPLALLGVLGESRFGVPELGSAVLLLTPTLFFAGVTQVSGRIMQRSMQFGPLVTAEISAYVLGYGLCGIPLALLGWDYYALVAAHLTYSFFVAAILVWLTRPPLGLCWDKTALFPLASFGAKHTVGNLLDYAASSVPRLLVLHALGVTALGLYARASDLTNRLKVILTKINSTVLYPALAQRRDDLGKLKLAFLRSSLLIFAVGAPSAILACIFADKIILLLFGSQWEASVLPFRILIFVVPLEAIGAISSSVLLTMGHPGANVYANAIFLAASIIFGLALAGYGVAGVAAAILLAILVRTAVLIVLLHSHTRLTVAEVLQALSSKPRFFPSRSKPWR